MKVDIKYIFECKGGFRYIRDTFSEIKQVVDENYEALKNMARNGDSVNMYMDYNNPYSPTASISACIDGTWKFYSLYTKVTEL